MWINCHSSFVCLFARSPWLCPASTKQQFSVFQAREQITTAKTCLSLQSKLCSWTPSIRATSLHKSSSQALGISGCQGHRIEEAEATGCVRFSMMPRWPDNGHSILNLRTPNRIITLIHGHSEVKHSKWHLNWEVHLHLDRNLQKKVEGS